MRKELNDFPIRLVADISPELTEVQEATTVFAGKEIQIIDPISGTSNQRQVEIEDFEP